MSFRVGGRGAEENERDRQTDKVALLISDRLPSPCAPLTEINLNDRKATEADASPDQAPPTPFFIIPAAPSHPFVLCRRSLQQIRKVRYHVSGTFCCWGGAIFFFIFFFMIIILQLWQCFQCGKRPIHSFTFFFPEEKNTLISLKTTVPLRDLARGSFAEGCQWAIA